MTADSIITETRQRGIDLSAVAGRIAYRAPEVAITPDIIQGIRAVKADLLVFLAEGHPRCLGVYCQRADFKACDGIKWLWCHQVDRPVVRLMACPAGGWTKDSTGFPLPDRDRRLSA